MIKEKDVTNLPVSPRSLESLTIARTDTFSVNLNGLNVSTYSNLRCLKLISLHLEDVRTRIMKSCDLCT